MALEIPEVSARAFAAIRDIDVDAIHALPDAEIRPLLPCLVSWPSQSIDGQLTVTEIDAM